MDLNLEKEADATGRKNLIFTSAGNSANVSNWIGPERNWDLWICYYGDGERDLSGYADYYHEHQAGKFPNLYFAYQRWPEIFKSYDAVMVLDDDIVITNRNLDRLFEIRREFDLWLTQPAFSPTGKASHRLTNVRGFRHLTYTNFVEVCAPLFRRDKMEEFLRVYDPSLVGWGIDYWCSHLFQGERYRLAIIHSVTCINPHDDKKTGKREIDALQTMEKRKATWEALRAKLEIPEYRLCQYDTIWLPYTPFNILRGIYVEVRRKFYRHRVKYLRRKGNEPLSRSY